MNPASHSSCRPRRGIALLFTLAAIVLVTGVVIVFLSRALTQRNLSFSSANSAKAERLAQFAEEYLVGEVRQEIADGSSSFEIGGVKVLQPIAAVNAAPHKTGIDTPYTIGALTIAKVSNSSEPLRPGSTEVASTISIDHPSLNGRLIREERWFGSSGPALGSQEALPTWYYVTRSKGLANPSVSDASKPANDNYVVGRFATTVYDVSGLLNVNVAGYPSTAQSVAENKGTTAYADLSVVDPSFAASSDQFYEWRNGPVATASAGNYETYLTDVAMPNGFNVSATDQNTILNRQDLLRAAREGNLGLTETLVSYLTTSSNFKKAPSWQPANVAGSTIAYGDLANDGASSNRFTTNVRFTADATDILHYNDDGTLDEAMATANAGEPLIRERFSLAKLAWIGYDGPNAAAFDSSLSQTEMEAAIEACFGLEWDDTNFRWNYTAHSASPNAIMTLEEVAMENREPNFFELLKAGILSGSLAKHPGEVCGSALPPPDAGTSTVGAAGVYYKDDSGAQPSYSDEPNLHIMQIGANLIDQVDEDSYPTSIYFPAYPADPLAQLYEFYNTAYGLENLPQLHRLYMLAFEDPRAAPETTHDTPTAFKFWLVPEFWNPSQTPLATATAGPTNFRMRAHGAMYGAFGHNKLSRPPPSGFGLRGTTIDYDSDPTSPSASTSYRDIYFSDQPEFREGPTVLDYTMIDDSVEVNDPHNYWSSSIPDWDEFNGNATADTEYGYFKFAGIYAGSSRWPKDPAESPWSSTSGVTFFSLQFHPELMVTFTLECWDGTRWIPYAQYPRIAVNPVTNDAGMELWDTAKTYDGSLTLYGRNTIFTPDPRTDRLSSAFARRNGGKIPGSSAQWNLANAAEYDKSGTPVQRAIEQYYPRQADGFEFPGCVLNDSTFKSSANTAAWMVNQVDNPSASSDYNGYYTDPDGVVRPADGFRRDDATGDGIYMMKRTDFAASAERRAAIVLNRPFRSVAEMGYASRDLPGKNLDFWSTQSADAGLLDLFAVTDAPQSSADGINPNAAPGKVLESLLGSSLAMVDTSGTVVMTATDAEDVATAVSTHLGNEANLPLANRSDLVVMLGDVINGALPTDNGMQANKAMAEAPVRALADVSETRTWNLLIDVVAQSGRVPEVAEDLGDFIVEGERRVWVHVAIDRVTGEVISYRREPVYE